MANLSKSHFGPPCPCTNLKPCCVAAIYTQGDQVCPSALHPTVPSQSSYGQLQDGSHEDHEDYEGHESHEAPQRPDGNYEGHEGHEVHEGQQHHCQAQDQDSHEGHEGHGQGQDGHGPMGHPLPEARMHQLGVALEAMLLPVEVPVLQETMGLQPPQGTPWAPGHQGRVQGQVSCHGDHHADQVHHGPHQLRPSGASRSPCFFRMPLWPTTTGHKRPDNSPAAAKGKKCALQPSKALYGYTKSCWVHGAPWWKQMPCMANLLKCHIWPTYSNAMIANLNRS